MVIVSMMKKYDMAAERCGEREANAQKRRALS
jgi:hypothetical protein